MVDEQQPALLTAHSCSMLGIRVEASQTVPSCNAQAQQHSAAPRRAGTVRRQLAAINLPHAEPASAQLPDQTTGDCLSPRTC